MNDVTVGPSVTGGLIDVDHVRVCGRGSDQTRTRPGKPGGGVAHVAVYSVRLTSYGFETP
jgi:hypothetical protein